MMKVNRTFKISQMLMIGLLIIATWYVNASSPFFSIPKSDSVTYYSKNLEGPFVAHILEVDLTDNNIGLMAWRSGGLITTSRQLRDASTQGNRVFGGVNADFFSFQSTLPIGNQVTNGEFVYGIHSKRSHVVTFTDGRIDFEAVSFKGSVETQSGYKMSITGVNRHRANDQAMFYNQYYNGISRNDSTGVEIVVSPANGHQWIAGNTTTVTVASVKSGYMNVSKSQYVLSIGRNHPDFNRYSRIGAGDTLSVFLGFTNSELTNVDQVVGGGGRILRDGADATSENQNLEGIAEAFLSNRHPRTLVATNRDASKAWLVVVDGRQASSLGMSFPEMANMLLELGAWDAVNLDGGGSSTMIYQDQVVNSPSDPTGERAVANVLMVVSK
jgi:hypothetical protein